MAAPAEACQRRRATSSRRAAFSTPWRQGSGTAPSPLNAPEMLPAMHAMLSESPSVLTAVRTVCRKSSGLRQWQYRAEATAQAAQKVSASLRFQQGAAHFLVRRQIQCGIGICHL